MSPLVILSFCLSFAFGHPSIKPRIYGGEDAADGQFPYHVTVRYYGIPVCGGSIIGPNTVLTAGRCVFNISVKPEDLTVVVGSNKVEEGTTFLPTKFYAHPKLDPEVSAEYDLGIIKVHPAFNYSASVQPIKLAETSIDDSKSVVTTGFGFDKEIQPFFTETLKFIKLRTLNLKECKKRACEYADWVLDSSVCTISDGKSGFCYADYGGALINEDTEQVGIVSWNNCPDFDYPDVYTNVVSYKDWIKEQLEL